MCQNMNIVNTLPEYTKPKNVGLMFFSMEPEKFFPNAQIDVVQFPEGLGGNDIIEKTFRGLLHRQLRDALQYIQNVIITEKVVKHPDRAERKQAILRLVSQNPTITQSQIMEQMNLTRKQVQKDMKELQDEGVLVREGKNRSGYWLVSGEK